MVRNEIWLDEVIKQLITRGPHIVWGLPHDSFSTSDLAFLESNRLLWDDTAIDTPSLTKHTVATYLHTYGWPMYTYPFVYGEAPHLGNLISPIHLTQPRTCATIQLSNGVSHLVIAVYACIIIESYDHIYIYIYVYIIRPLSPDGSCLNHHFLMLRLW